MKLKKSGSKWFQIGVSHNRYRELQSNTWWFLGISLNLNSVLIVASLIVGAQVVAIAFKYFAVFVRG